MKFLSHRKNHGVNRNKRMQLELLEPRVLLAGDTYLINFQNDEATIPTGYERDLGELFAARGNGLTYGWSSDHTDQAVERSAEADQRLDTLIMIESGQDWEFQLANGSYEVTVAVGDPGNNDGEHTINVEGVNFFNAVADTSSAMVATNQVVVADGRLTLDANGAANLDTRINYIHIVGIPSAPNNAPSTPTVTEPSTPGQIVNPADVHLEAVGFSDPDGDLHKSSDWEIWTVGVGAEPVWQTLGIEGVERLHTHLGDGIFINSLAGQSILAENTDYELRVRFRDDAGSVSGYSTQLFQTGSESSVFSMQIEDVLASPAPAWETLVGAPIELPSASSILSAADTIIAIDTDGNSSYPGAESPQNAVDGTLNKYLNFGEVNSGFIVTPLVGASIVDSFEMTTANDFEERDPTTWQLFGTNDAIVSADNSDGSSETWTFIDSGSLSLPSARDTLGSTITVSNSTSYTSYRMVFTGVKNPGAANSMQFAEIQFFGQQSGTSALLSSGNPIIAIDTDGNSGYPAGEEPDNAIDGSLDKYLNFGKINSGFIVTPPNSSTIVKSFVITTANDEENRDPTTWQLFGTNNAITSTDNSTGGAENWTLIDAGVVSLPSARDTLGPSVSVSNSTAYSSYRMIFTGVKNSGAANSMQIGEIQFFGESGVPPTEPSLRIESGTGDLLLSIEGDEASGNLVTNPSALLDHVDVRVAISGGSTGLTLSNTDLTFTDDDLRVQTIFLPNMSIAAGETKYFWVSADGSTYFGQAGQTTPNFTTLARAADLSVPYLAMQPGFVVEEVGTDYRLPVNIAFVPNPGPNPDDPLYYVTELYGSIQVVTNDGTKHEFATGLLDYNPTGPISGSGEQGLTGITVERDSVDPDIYHLYVGMLWDNGSPPGGASHYPKVERIDSVAGGLSMDTRTVLLNMQPETQGQSHQISNITIGPDDKLYVHNGDGFDASTALDLDQYRGKILRMNKDGTAATDNPFYNAGDGINARDYVFAYGLRNPFGGAWRDSDGKHYSVENGPSVDRLAQINAGVSYGWDGSNASMTTNAAYNWDPAHAPVNITFVQQSTFGGSQLPQHMWDHAFVSESGPTYAAGAQTQGKRIVEFEFDAAGNVVGGPTTLVEYVGLGHSSVVGLSAGPDGLYFTELYEESGASGPTATGSRIFRVRYTGGPAGDFDLDTDVDDTDLAIWESNYDTDTGATVLEGDADGNGAVTGLDFLLWQTNYTGAEALSASSTPAPVQSALGASPESSSVNAPSSDHPQGGSQGVRGTLTHEIALDGTLAGSISIPSRELEPAVFIELSDAESSSSNKFRTVAPIELIQSSATREESSRSDRDSHEEGLSYVDVFDEFFSGLVDSDDP